MTQALESYGIFYIKVLEILTSGTVTEVFINGG